MEGRGSGIKGQHGIQAYDGVGRMKLWRCLEEKGLTGRAVGFLKAAYLGISCEVKVGDEYSDLFEVTTGLRQGCILSPLLFSLYINSFVDILREECSRVNIITYVIVIALYSETSL